MDSRPRYGDRFPNRNNNNNNSNNNKYANNRRGPPPQQKINREKTCPFLLRVFVSTGNHRPDQEYSTLPLKDEHQLYSWRDSTLRELLTLLRDSSPRLRNNSFARYSVRIVYYDSIRNCFNSREFGSLSVKEILEVPIEGTMGYDRGSKSMEDGRFVIGDYIDVAYQVPSTLGSFTSAPTFNNNDRRSDLTSGGPRGGGGGFGGNDRGREDRDRPTRNDTWAPSSSSSRPTGPRGGAFIPPTSSTTTSHTEKNGPTGAWGRTLAVGGGAGGGNRRGDDNGDRRVYNGAGADGGGGRGGYARTGEGWDARRDRDMGRATGGDGSSNRRDNPPHRQQNRRSSRSLSPPDRKRAQRSRSNSPVRESWKGDDDNVKGGDNLGSKEVEGKSNEMDVE